MMPEKVATITDRLDARRRELRMGYAVLAKRSGVSVPTIVRTLSGSNPNASFESVLAIADALGMLIQFQKTSAGKMLEEQAERKANQLLSIVQGTSALEAQGLDVAAARDMKRQLVHELRAGSPRRLWGE